MNKDRGCRLNERSADEDCSKSNGNEERQNYFGRRNTAMILHSLILSTSARQGEISFILG